VEHGYTVNGAKDVIQSIKYLPVGRTLILLDAGINQNDDPDYWVKFSLNAPFSVIMPRLAEL